LVDDSELDYIRTFLLKVHTAATTKQKEEQPRLSKIADTERMLVNEGEVLKTSDYSVTKRYKVDIEADSEANLSAAINNIVIGIRKLEAWQTITAYTRPASLYHIIFRNANKAQLFGKRGTWTQTIELEVEWGVA